MRSISWRMTLPILSSSRTSPLFYSTQEEDRYPNTSSAKLVLDETLASLWHQMNWFIFFNCFIFPFTRTCQNSCVSDPVVEFLWFSLSNYVLRLNLYKHTINVPPMLVFCLITFLHHDPLCTAPLTGAALVFYLLNYFFKDQKLTPT